MEKSGELNLFHRVSRVIWLNLPLYILLFFCIYFVEIDFIDDPKQFSSLRFSGINLLSLKVFAFESLLLLGALYLLRIGKKAKRKAVFTFFRIAAIFTIAWVIAFHVAEFYFFKATGCPLNLFAIIDNFHFIREGSASVLLSPGVFLLAVGCLLYYMLPEKFVRAAFKGYLGRLSYKFTYVMVFCLLSINLLAAFDFASDPIRASVQYLRPFFGGWELVSSLRAQSLGDPLRRDLAIHPRSSTRKTATIQNSRRYSVIAITIESFNQIYLHPEKIHPNLKTSIMPNFEKLIGKEIYFDNVYSTSAHTINGFVSHFCSQMTLRERVWNATDPCLPQLLSRQGYDVQELNAFVEYAPHHYPTLHAMGFDHPQDAASMRISSSSSRTGFMYDQETFGYALNLLAKMKPPFLFHVSTNQTHQPGFFPAEGCPTYHFPANVDLPPATLNMIRAAHCTDFYLKKFLDEVRTKVPKDTIIYVTADHATNIALHGGMDTDISKIPLLFILPPSLRVAVKGADTHLLGGTFDIAPSLLDLLRVNGSRKWMGISLFHPSPGRDSIESVSETNRVAIYRVDGRFQSAKFARYAGSITLFDRAGSSPADEKETELAKVVRNVFNEDAKAFY